MARWFPSVHDPISGRFVADQLRGICESGRVHAHAVTFEPAPLTGSVEDRERQFAAVQAVTRASHRGPDLFQPRGWGAPQGATIARPTLPTGWVSAKDEADHQGADRLPAMLAVADALAGRLPARALVHAHTAYPDGNGAAHLAARLGLPLVITEHSTFLGQQLADPPRRSGVLAAMHAAERVITVSDMLGNEIREALPEIAHKLRIIPNVVATDDFELVDPRQRRPDEILFVGYLREVKGIDLLFDAFARVLAARPSARLRLLGRAPTLAEEQRWVDHVARLGLGGAVAFEGPADRAEVVAAMSRASMLVHAGYRETFGVVAVEALATGLPVVATDSGGITEILGDEPDRFGHLVRSREPEPLATAILDVLDNRERYDPRALRAHVDDRFDIRTVSTRIVDLYEEVVDEWASPGTSRPAPAQPRGASSRAVAASARAAPVPVILVASNARRTLQLLEPLSPATRARLTIVTLAPVVEGELRELGVARVVVVDAEATFRRALARAGAVGVRGSLAARVLRLARDPFGPLRRRRVRAERETILRDARQLTVLDEARQIRTGRDPVLVICQDAADFVIVEPLVGKAEIRVAPGGLRWLADGDYVPEDGNPTGGA